MRPGPREGPPRLLRRLLRQLLPDADRDDLIRELDALYVARCRRRGRGAARLWYLRQLVSFPVRLVHDTLRGRARRRRAGSAAATLSASPVALLDALSTDLRLGARRMADRPGTTLATVLTLGIGIAGAATTWMLADWVLLRPVPGIPAPDGLLTARLETTQARGPSWRISHPDLERLAGLVPSLAALAASSSQPVHFATTDEPTRLPAQLVTADYFDVLGVAPVAGRTFAPDEGAGATDAHVAVISHRLERRHWAGERSAVGATVRINGVPHTVIGVAPPGFHGAELPGETEVWLPAGDHAVVLRAGAGLLARPMAPVWQQLIGRRHEGAPASRVEVDLDRAMEVIRRRHGRHSFVPTHFVFRVYPGVGLAPSLRLSVPHTLGIVGTAAAVLLLLSCVNVAGLGLAGEASRRPATAVCRALGAGRGQLVRERLVEGLLVGAGAGLVGVAVTLAIGPLLRDASVSRLGVQLQGMSLGARGLTVTTFGALAAGLLARLVPALSAAGSDVMLALRSGRHGGSGALRARGVLVVTQVALSAVLVVGAGLLARTLWNLRAVDMGISEGEIVTFQVDPAIQGYDAPGIARLVDEVIGRLESDPAVARAGAIFTEPLSGRYIAAPLVPTGADPATDMVTGDQFQVSPSWFRAAGIPLVAGRYFHESEGARGPAAGPGEPGARAAESPEDAAVPGESARGPIPGILSEAFARALFPGVPATEVVGRAVETPGGRQRAIVVGVVRDARLAGVASDERATFYVPWSDGFASVEEVTFWVRARADASGGETALAAAGTVRETVRELDPLLPVYSLEILRSRIDRHLSEQRFVARTGVLTALLGLLLAAVGLYSVLSHAVVERTREIGVRTALGATPGNVLLMIVRGGLVLTGAGIVAGLLGSLPLLGLLEARLFGVEPLDPWTYLAGVVILLAVALMASGLPALRAVRLDPMKSLQSD